MKKIALGVVALLVVVILGILGYAATKPDIFRIERSITINAPADRIFPLINDMHSWHGWSPYENLDPNMKRTFSGPASGKGAVYEWSGNDQVGQGRMEVIDVKPPSTVTIKLSFIKPFQAENTAEFKLVPEGDSTKVTWAMFGPNDYMCKVMQTVFNMDAMCGKDFEKGLSSMKKAIEQ